ncbi:bifunctional folylpolyglutamate synthase/dihydrofolate synthase [Capillimicrobium parvum]|uniref:tetrahydrofolate synthase n=1 Tax=Capillimicrobium parvum TaxID=2884022 RepID=A0A9E6Y0V1_9ACTN|nr:cyanophycin synthetase [Capillimicrobium parvum]UGS37552.1 Dihydrofolate synthase/folylpolyglutamate synthase [Capillimicrobium parvum]
MNPAHPPGAAGAAPCWTEDQAEGYLLGLELFGMRFGLDRMRRLLLTLGEPQQRFGSVHVVGTNGKSSTVRMIAAILERHGLCTGAYLSPHLVRFGERVRIGEQDVSPDAFAAAVQRAAGAAAKVDRTLGEDDRVTQFEALTAATFSEMARREVDVAVIEAGLGGRWDATNVLDSRVAVLTNVGLEHTRWLGPTVRDIAREKLAVVRPGSTLVVGPDLHPDAMDEARRVDARLVVASAGAAGDAVELAARGGFQRRNFAVARAAAEAYLGGLDEAAVMAAAAGTLVPGRFEQLSADPPTFLDGAHNPGGMVALAETVREELAGRPLTLVLSILDDKDAGEMLRQVVPLARRVVATSNANPRALSPATLESLARQVGATDVRGVADPRRALAVAREAAGAENGAVLVTGSIYLIADLLRTDPGKAGSTL